jgi:hypothetical protein
MTSEQFKKAIDNLGLTLSGAADLLGVHPRTTRRWANAERQIPGPVSNFLRHLMVAQTKATSTARVARARKTNGKIKSCVGPTIVVRFIDGVTVRMTVFTPLDRLDWTRGERLAREAYASRVRQMQPQLVMPRSTLEYLEQYIAARAVPIEVPPIAAARFEQNGKILAQREFLGGAHVTP